MNFNTHTKKGI